MLGSEKFFQTLSFIKLHVHRVVETLKRLQMHSCSQASFDGDSCLQLWSRLICVFTRDCYALPKHKLYALSVLLCPQIWVPGFCWAMWMWNPFLDHAPHSWNLRISCPYVPSPILPSVLYVSKNRTDHMAGCTHRPKSCPGRWTFVKHSDDVHVHVPKAPLWFVVELGTT